MPADNPVRQPESQVRTRQYEWQYRSLIIVGAGLIFFLTFTSQSLGWLGITRELRSTIATSDRICIPTSSIEWLDETPLNSFSITAYSLILQGHAPEKIILVDNYCAESDFTAGFPLAQDWDWYAWDQGWFEMSQLKAGLIAEQAIGAGGE